MSKSRFHLFGLVFVYVQLFKKYCQDLKNLYYQIEHTKSLQIEMEDLMRQRYTNNSWRVKVYLLNLGGNWDDCGTGILEISKGLLDAGEEDIEYFKVFSTEDEQKSSGITISSEKLNYLKGKQTNSRCILYLPILKKNQFEKQGGFKTND